MYRIAFLYFDDIHHVYHSVSIAQELATLSDSVTVELLTSTEKNRDLLEALNQSEANPKLSVRLLAPPLAHRLLHAGRRQFPRKSRILKKHRRLLAGFDAIVGTELSTASLRRYLKEETPPLILTRHGAGDRSYGFNKKISEFDFVLAAGTKIRDRLVKQGLMEKNRISVCGYQKLDCQLATYYKREEIFPDTAERKTIVYNPHSSKELGSWHSHGPQILDYFCQSSKYNLIFAPHIMLFDRRFGNTIEERWKQHPHIHIDTGSLASSDMSYTRLADIYLGDVSSQIYEFLVNPRYCIFLNSHNARWQNNPDYLSWTAGDVIETDSPLTEQLDTLLPDSENRQQHYLPVQTRLLASTIATDPKQTASNRAANAILGFLDNNNKENRRLG